MGYFRQFDDLGIISVNQWYVLDIGILPHEEDGADTSGTRTAMTGTGEGRRFLFQHTDAFPWDFHGGSQLWGR